MAHRRLRNKKKKITKDINVTFANPKKAQIRLSGASFNGNIPDKLFKNFFRRRLGK